MSHTFGYFKHLRTVG